MKEKKDEKNFLVSIEFETPAKPQAPLGQGIEVLEFRRQEAMAERSQVPLGQGIDVLEFRTPKAAEERSKAPPRKNINKSELVPASKDETSEVLFEEAVGNDVCNPLYECNTCVPENNFFGIQQKNIIFASLQSPSQKEKLLLENRAFQKIVKAEDASATNFSVRPIQQFIFLNREGKEDVDRAAIECIVLIREVPRRMTIKVNEIRSIARIVQKHFPEAILDFEEKNAEKMMEMKFRNAMQYCKKTYIYFQPGWQSINGVMYYLRDGMKFGEGITIKTGMTLPTIPYSNSVLLCEILEKSMAVYKEDLVMSVIFVFSLMGILYRLFKEAGLTPHFTLFLYGITGCMKTTIAKIFFIQLCDDRYRENIRRIDADTAVSLERAIVSSGHDTITLIDDFSPAKTETKKREMNDKLEMVIRMVGDGSSRSRSNMKLEDKRGEGVQGMVALTGELMGKGLSTNLRCLYCKMEKGKANVDAITWLQENPCAYTTMLADFADYVSENYRFIIEYIFKNTNAKRREISETLTELRLIDSVATLCIAANIFKGFMMERCQIAERIAEERVRRLEKGIVKCAVNNQMMSTEESPGVIFIQAVAALMRINQIVLNTEKVKMADVTVFDGFEDESFFYFNPESIHKKVVAFLKSINCFFPYEPKEIQAILADEGIIKTAPNGSGKRTYCIRIPIGNGKKYGFLKVRKTIYEMICTGDYDIEKGEKE